MAALRPPAVIYREEQHFGWWVYALLLVMAALAWGSLFWPFHALAVPAGWVHAWRIEVPAVFAIGVTLPTVLIVGVLRMTTEVTPTDCRVWFGWVPTYRCALPINTVQRVEVVRYRPIADYWGWGVRVGRDGERVLNARGDRGVRLHLVNGSRLLIGSQNPEALAIALEQAIHPAA